MLDSVGVDSKQAGVSSTDITWMSRGISRPIFLQILKSRKAIPSLKAIIPQGFGNFRSASSGWSSPVDEMKTGFNPCLSVYWENPFHLSWNTAQSALPKNAKLVSPIDTNWSTTNLPISLLLIVTLTGASE